MERRRYSWNSVPIGGRLMPLSSSSGFGAGGLGLGGMDMFRDGEGALVGFTAFFLGWKIETAALGGIVVGEIRGYCYEFQADS